MHEVTDCGLSFFKWRKNRVEANAHNAGGCPASNAIHGHINDFLVRTGLRSGVSELQLPCFYGSESRDSADVRRCFLPLRTTPSVAEQEGQLIETEATGAPQKNTIIH
nr:hypothetical protein [Escherichia coli]